MPAYLCVFERSPPQKKSPEKSLESGGRVFRWGSCDLSLAGAHHFCFMRRSGQRRRCVELRVVDGKTIDREEASLSTLGISSDWPCQGN